MTNEHAPEGAVALPKTLRWRHGFLLALPASTSLFISVGFMIGAIGAWPAIAVGGCLALVALLQNKLFAEMASMFPDKPGGVPMYATEAWKRYFAPIGPLVAFGYWCGWAMVLSLTGLTIGYLLQAQWFPDQTWVLFSTGPVDIGFPHVVTIALLVACTFLNSIGIHLAVRFHEVIGAVFLVLLAVLTVGPLVSGGWSAVELTSHLDGGWKAAAVWLYVSAWTLYASEMCASFAPEYKETVRDTSIALRSVGLFMLFVYVVLPVTLTGQLGEATVAGNPTTYGVISMERMLGSGFASLTTAILCAVLFLGMVSSAADAARALFGIAEEGMSVRQLARVNGRGMPVVALVATMVVNVFVVLFVGNPVAILVASNIGYLLAITMAVFAFLLLRRDRPELARPIRLGRGWPAVAVAVGVFNLVILCVGVTNPGLSYAADGRDVLIGLVLLAVGLVLFVYRQVVQDRTGIRLRDTTHTDLARPPAESDLTPQF